ncbi:MAG: hypothetical protein Kow0063_04670 [Anaerolineae bacterium]
MVAFRPMRALEPERERRDAGRDKNSEAKKPVSEEWSKLMYKEEERKWHVICVS